MKVVISHKPLHSGSKNRGIGVYTRELIAAFHKSLPKIKLIPSSNPDAHDDVDIIHYPFFDPFFLTLPRVFRKPTVVTIHDLTPLKFPEHFKAGLRGKLKFYLQKQRVKKADHIITDSQASKDDIVRLLGVSSDKVTVIPLAHSPEKIPVGIAKKIAAKYQLPAKYLLYVGDINWNKNVVGLIEAFSKLKEEAFHLVLIGKVFSDEPNIPEWQAVKQAIAQSVKKELIHVIGYVPTHHLPVFYQRATLYVQPSWYEGFGLPLLEAMTYGCPVACSDRGSLPEVGGDAVAYFDPAKNMAEVVDSLLASSAKREKLAEKGLERVKLFSWKKVAQETAIVYEQVVRTNNV